MLVVFGVSQSALESIRVSNNSTVVLGGPNSRIPLRMPCMDAIWMLSR